MTLNVPVGLLFAPLLYTIPGGAALGAWTTDTFAEAAIAVPLGVASRLASIHLCDVTARLLGGVASALS